jgi:hypothetical protein
MRKFTQRELLSEGFWDSFKSAAIGGAKGAMQVGKEIANVVAPEITEPFKKLQDWKKGATHRIKAAANPQQEVLDYLFELGMMPLPGEKVRTGQKTKDGSQLYIVKVQEFDYDENSNIKPGYQFNPKNNTAIIKVTNDNNVEKVRLPERRYARDTSQNSQAPVQQQSQTPP